MAYGQIGIIQMTAAFCGYFVVMAQHGFLPLTLVGIRREWENRAETVTDSYGQQWGYAERKVRIFLRGYFCCQFRLSFIFLFIFFLPVLFVFIVSRTLLSIVFFCRHLGDSNSRCYHL